MIARRAFVLDCNVLVDAALFRQSFGRRALDIVRGLRDFVLSPAIFREVTEVLNRPRLRRYVEEHERRAFLRRLTEEALLAMPNEAIRVCRDPKDDIYLEAAVAANAEAIISRDKDLISLDPFRSTRIFEAQSFVEQFGA
jgi:hypothetical protein